LASRTRRRLSATLLCAGLALAAGIGAGRASVGPVEQSGIFALFGGSPKIVSELWAVHGGGLTATLNVRQFAFGSKKPIADYDLDMERLMHLVVVRDDFATFAHLHPRFDPATGTFSQLFTKAPNHRYYVYADSTPHGLGQQVFRFTLESDGPAARLPHSFAPSPPAVAAGPYTITLSTTALPASQPSRLNVTVSKNGAPARDLAPYLGAAAHAVFINASTLQYVHVHPTAGSVAAMNGAMAGMEATHAAGPHMTMLVPALPAGTYKLWLQFNGAGALYAAAFTLPAR
jgi:hypothetical protein